MLDKVIHIDQSPIGRTPRSNPATYTGLFTPIRDLYAMLPESRERGYKPGRFSFNVKGGRCEACQGDGLKRIEMNFLPDVYVTCDVCRGRRYNHETLQVKYKGYSIADLLDATVEEALPLLENIPQIRAKLQTLNDVGLGYIHLGQSSTTLSGGEAQRIKLAKELSKRQTGRTFYILDEPTTGLHFDDVRKLLDVLQRLVDLGNTVVVIEHNLDVIKTADWIIDLGPDGGEYGGRVVACGTPEQVSRSKKSYTAEALRKVLAQWEGGMSRYGKQPLDFAGLKTVCLHERGGKVKAADFASAYRQGRGCIGVARFAAAHPGRRFVSRRGGGDDCGAREAAGDHLGNGRARDQVRPCAGADRPDAARLCDGVRDERLGGDSRFRDRPRRTHQRRRGGRAAGWPLRLGGRNRPRDESRAIAERRERRHRAWARRSAAGSSAIAPPDYARRSLLHAGVLTGRRR